MQDGPIDSGCLLHHNSPSYKRVPTHSQPPRPSTSQAHHIAVDERPIRSAEVPVAQNTDSTVHSITPTNTFTACVHEAMFVLPS